MGADHSEPPDHSGDHEPMPEGKEPPPRGVKTMAIVRWVFLALAILVAVFAWASYARERMSPRPAPTAAAPAYQCPMHPQVVSNEPGECPICHMDLVPVAAAAAGNETKAAGTADAASALPLVILDDSGPPTFWCPMDTHVRSAKPGRCPLCKMALEPIPPGADGDTAAATAPPGTVPIELALDRIQSIGVRTAVVEERTVSAGLRVTAIVQAPEQGAAQVHVRSAGFVEAIHVDQTGKPVAAGQALLSLYSPEILQAQHELLATRGWAADASVAPGSARNKLELLGMTPADIDRVVAKHEPLRAVAVVAPRGGFVTKKNVVLGSYVTPEMVLYEIQDLSRVYVVGDVFLRDLPHVSTGAEARFVPAGRPAAAVTGKIDLVYPTVDAEARTRRVRMQLPNKGNASFTPGEYGMLEVAARGRSALVVPRDAVVDTGSATYVFVVERQGRFVPRSVTLDGTDGEHVVVADGVKAGERVVSGATFLIDSESRLQAAVAQATRGGGDAGDAASPSGAGGSPTTHTGHGP